MKTFRLLIVSLLLATSASAQHHRGERRGGDYSPTVYLISVHEVDTIYNCGGCAAQQAAALNRMAVGNATQDYIDTHRPGFQQTEKPQFVFASKNNRFSFSMGGFVAMRDGVSVELTYLSEPTAQLIRKMDLSAVAEFKRNGNGTVEVKFVDRVKALSALYDMLGGGDADEAAEFLQALEQAGEEREPWRE